MRAAEKRCILKPMLSSTRSTLLVAALLAAGCDNEVRSGHIYAGSSYDWDQLSHRLALARTVMNEDGSAELGMIGGDWSTGGSFSDFPYYRIRTQSVTAKGFAVVHGETTFTLAGTDGEATQSVTVTDATVAGMRDQIVVLRGYEIDTDVTQSDPSYPTATYDPALGYTSRGFGFRLGEASTDGDDVSFDVTAALRWGPLDREDMNEAIPYAETSVTVAWTVIGFKGSHEVVSLGASEELDWEPPYSEHDPFGEGDLDFPASEEALEIVGLQSFDLGLEAQSGTGTEEASVTEGAYLRRWGFEVVQGDNGAPSYAIGQITNSSVSEEIGVVATVSADVARIWLKDKDATIDISVLEGSHDVGDAVAAAE